MLEKKGTDEAKITGAASSYARKYALNGLFCIDDTKDADATNDHRPKADQGKPAKVDDAKLPPTATQVMEAFTAAADQGKLDALYKNATGKYVWNDADLKAIVARYDDRSAELSARAATDVMAT